MAADAVHAAVDWVLRPGNFFLAPPATLRVEFVSAQRMAWEVFRGHLLDAAQTRESIVVDSWNIFVDVDRACETPLISIHHQADPHLIHITRQILTSAFEAYEDSPGVILSRAVEKWSRELVGTVAASSLEREELASELAALVFLAIIGTSRLPITSIESPLPAFSLGQLGYMPRMPGSPHAWNDPTEWFRAAVGHAANVLEVAKALETALRCATADELPRLAEAFGPSFVADPKDANRAAKLFRALFNNVALSPYTQFVERLVGLLTELELSGRVSAEVVLDTVSYMLRHLCRHLTAFDLERFHNLGANYPDALFLDALLNAYLRLIEERGDLMVDQPRDSAATVRSKHRRRRALRQACLLRKAHEGHAVPDAPTSLGESQRILPRPYVRVSHEQIVQPATRRRKLFDGDPLEDKLTDAARQLLRESTDDLAGGELLELGLGVFLARPLGILKAPGEVDRTPLVAYEAFSRLIAEGRLGQLKDAGWLSSDGCERLRAALDKMVVTGIPCRELSASDRPGVVSLADLAKAAPDFVVLRSTSGSVRELLSHYDLEPLRQNAPQLAGWLERGEPKILLPVEPQGDAVGRLVFYDAAARPRLELAWSSSGPRGTPYAFRRGQELVERLQLLRVGEYSAGAALEERELRDSGIWLELAPTISGLSFHSL